MRLGRCRRGRSSCRCGGELVCSGMLPVASCSVLQQPLTVSLTTARPTVQYLQTAAVSCACACQSCCHTPYGSEGCLLLQVQSRTMSAPAVVTGPVVLAKSPVAHMGDVRRVEAVAPPGSAGQRLAADYVNVVVFSQQGQRPLPNMLSGSDLVRLQGVALLLCMSGLSSALECCCESWLRDCAANRRQS